MSEDDVLSHSLVSTYSHAVKALRPGIVHRLDKGTTGSCRPGLNCVCRSIVPSCRASACSQLLRGKASEPP